MTCLEAQSKIMAFIENKLPDDELKEFIKHVKKIVKTVRKNWKSTIP